MINPKELKIGNIINWHGRDVAIEGVTETYITSYEDEDVLDPKYAEPIPLTSSWLERFGFTDPGLKIPGMRGKGYRMLIVGLHQVLLWNNGQWEISYNLEGQVVQAPCPQMKYVHQLQNLYYALTGEELVLLPQPPQQ